MGVLNNGRILDLSHQDIANTIAMHVTGPWRLVRALAPGIVARRYGRIVNTFAEGKGCDHGHCGACKRSLLRMFLLLPPKEVPVDVLARQEAM